jgi:dCTP deaminase
MSFWSSQCIKDKQQESEKLTPQSPLIHPYDKDNVMHAAYELSLDRDCLITPDDSTSGTASPNKKAIRIPPGQFALLLTKEYVNIPRNVIAFISLKGSVKFRGLVNISGFQVDPGFYGQLKFSVYNASSEDVHLNFGKPCFLIWFADLKAENECYDGDHKDQKGFTPDDRDRMTESRHSPETLHKRLKGIENQVTMITAVGAMIVFPLIIGLVVAIFDHWFGEKSDKIGDGGLIISTALYVGIGILLLNMVFTGVFGRFVRWIKIRLSEK